MVNKEIIKEVQDLNTYQCEYNGCDQLAGAYIRTKRVCGYHFRIIKADNIKKINNGEDIPTDLNI